MRYRALLAVFLAAAVLTPAAQAKSAWRTAFRTQYNATYGVTGSRIDNCTLCHPGGDTGQVNDYGVDYLNAGKVFTAIENIDSDGDGFTNLQEIAAFTYPGDSADKPTPTTGSLTVTLGPAGAVTAGAQWRVGTGAYQNSGVTISGLAAGSVTINFKAVTGWTTPADQSATIAVGGMATATGTYVQLALVPNVVGLAQATASSAVTSAGLTVGTIVQAYSPTVPAGTVMSQGLVAGNYVARGTAMGFTVSMGPQPVTVPGVVGHTQAEAATLITGAGLVVGQVTEEYTAGVPVGRVISQSPEGGESALPGTAVALVLSKGPQPVSVPVVGGQSQSAASALIVGAGLVVGTVTGQYNASVPTGFVIDQSTLGGSMVAPGTAVLLWVSKGPQPVITGSILVNKAAYSTNSVNATLSLTWSSNAVRMRFSDNGATWTPWESLKATRAYTLPAGDGYKTVRVQFIDIANNRSATFSDHILLDTTVPTGSVSINNNAKTTASPAVTLNLAYADTGSGIRSMRFSNDGATWSAWEAVAVSKAWVLAGPAGYNTVRVQYRDAAGNYSAVYNDYILYQPI